MSKRFIYNINGELKDNNIEKFTTDPLEEYYKIKKEQEDRKKEQDAKKKEIDEENKKIKDNYEKIKK